MAKKVLFSWLLATITIGMTICDAQGMNLKCAQNGEYCLTHNDCCSRSCLSFSYKCVPVPPNASVGTTLIPVQSTTPDVSNRFGGSVGDGGASLTQKTCALNGEYCLTHSECCSGSCLTFSYKCVPLSQAGTTFAGLDQSTSSITMRFGEDTPSSTTITKTTTSSIVSKQCAEVGEYCLTPKDCCSGSCLSFSYKCVTNYQLIAPASANTRTTERTSIIDRFGLEIANESNTKLSKCAAVGEYCLTSVECCSKSCLSFAYKCVNRYDLTAATDQVSPTSTIAEKNQHSGSAFNKEIANMECRSNGLNCFHNQECCSGSCFKSICSTEIRLGVEESELTKPSDANGPYIPVKNLDDLINRFGVQKPTYGLQTDAQMCKPAGDNCTHHGDCCTNHCNSYRRKCVN